MRLKVSTGLLCCRVRRQAGAVSPRRPVGSDHLFLVYDRLSP